MTPHDDDNYPHEQFRKLAAAASSGCLTTAELTELLDHLGKCAECRDIAAQFRALVAHGIPLLAESYAGAEAVRDEDHVIARRELLTRIRSIEHGDAKGRRRHSVTLDGARQMARIIVAAGLAASLLLGVATWLQHLRWDAANRADEKAASRQIDRVQAARRDAEALVQSQAASIRRLGAEESRARSEADDLRRQLRASQQRWNQQLDAASAEKAAGDRRLSAISLERDRLSGQLQAALHSAEDTQTQLARLRTEQERTLARQALLEAEVNELDASNRDQQRRLADTEQYLSSDRDIRELMGARNLYIADVFDVDSRGRTRRPFGRVFYTRGKSLIFYGFDLDRRKGVRTASAFQVWGQRDMVPAGQSRPFNLGILYLDSEANRRWILRFDDPRTLAEIDAVFVTVEPHGGSVRPTGKPFLFAMLRKEVNHP